MASVSDEAYFATAFRRNLEAELSGAELCPKCGKRLITEERDARAAGICTACLSRARLDAYKAATEELALRRQRATARQERSRLLSKRGDAE